MTIAAVTMMAGALLLGVWSFVLALFARPLRAFWREPVFRVPIAILESDDWGAGPVAQAPALARLEGLLKSIRNAHGEAPVMTIGVILETLNRDATRVRNEYVASTLADPPHDEVLEALRAGTRAGCFALQLHGQAHYWPETLMALGRSDRSVAAWLAEAGVGWTESLPSALQSRWTDARRLPSLPLPATRIAEAALAEVTAWRGLFGSVPTVAVPTTFVWNRTVERAWADAGVRVIVTPGSRHEGRDANGAPTNDGGPIVNGERGEGGVLFVVRDVYFEPAFGHAAERLADGVLARSALGRPALIEMHRFNFCGPRAVDSAFDTLREALELLLKRVPAVRFLSTAALADAFVDRDDAWLDTSSRQRAVVWARRARQFHPFARWARYSGLVWPLRLLESLA
jgi:hypothetical protein